VSDDSKKTILVVDDDPAIRILLRNTLQGQGYAVRTATNGREGLDQVEQEHPDTILLDVNMPEMDGLELCRRLKCQTETAHIPVIFMTSLGHDSDRTKGFDVGGDDYVIKPVNYKELLARLKRVGDGTAKRQGNTAALDASVATCLELIGQVWTLDLHEQVRGLIGQLRDELQAIQETLPTAERQQQRCG
jgi:DNA-binding response OmpR family regulator